QRDLQTVFYAENPVSPQEQDLRLLNGTVNKYSIGAAWHAAGLTVDDVNEQWDWGADFVYNVPFSKRKSCSCGLTGFSA
ncbi:MAG: hypothetical protein AAFR22_17625, partial [Chloroflexota bacterium]